MKLSRIRIRNFRAIADLEIELGSQTTFLGPNGVGKSCILKALDRFFSPSSKVEIDDFHERNVADDIEIALTFCGLNAEETERFKSRIHGGELSVVRVFEASSNIAKYFGLTPRHEGFREVRETVGAREKRDVFNAIQREGIYGDLGVARNAEQLQASMESWEDQYPEQCELGRDDGQFLGFSNVGRGSLNRFVHFVFVPAVRDAGTDAVDGKSSVVSQLIELLVRSVVAAKAEIRQWQERATAEYRELTSPERIGELRELSDGLSETLNLFYEGANVGLDWRAIDDLKVEMPTALVSLEEQGFVGPVDGKGHGLQRAFIFTILQHLAHATFVAGRQREEEALEGEDRLPENGGCLILAIEEPELYQHPTKQRHLANMLRLLSSGDVAGLMRDTQIILCSHSPHFVSTDRFDEIRLARREPQLPDGPSRCVTRQVFYDDVIDEISSAWSYQPGHFTIESLKARLHILNSDVAEGFFASVVLLVEGPGDAAAIDAVASALGIDLAAKGVSLISVDGKTKMDKPWVIFRKFGIPVYCIWDNDLHDADDPSGRACNIALQKLAGIPEPVSFQNQHAPNFTCLEDKLETLLATELGADFDKHVGLVGHVVGLKKKHLLKNPAGMRQVVAACYADGGRSPTLETAVRGALSLL